MEKGGAKISRKRTLNKLFPSRNKSIKALRNSGDDRLEMFNDSQGKSYLVNFHKRMAKGQTFVNEELNQELYLRFQRFMSEAVSVKESEVQE